MSTLMSRFVSEPRKFQLQNIFKKINNVKKGSGSLLKSQYKTLPFHFEQERTAAFTEVILSDAFRVPLDGSPFPVLPVKKLVDDHLGMYVLAQAFQHEKDEFKTPPLAARKCVTAALPEKGTNPPVEPYLVRRLRLVRGVICRPRLDHSTNAGWDVIRLDPFVGYQVGATPENNLG
jgi:hypothetical protein